MYYYPHNIIADGTSESTIYAGYAGRHPTYGHRICINMAMMMWIGIS